MINTVDQVVTDRYAIYQGDSCELIRAIPGDSIDFGVHSPPFEGLYRFSNSDRDISNNDKQGFWTHYAFLIQELLRVTKPGRLHSVHYIHTKPESVTETEWRDYRKQVLADAVLIAASPDMYAALDTFPMHEREDDAAYAQRVKRWWIEKGGPAIGRAQVRP